ADAHRRTGRLASTVRLQHRGADRLGSPTGSLRPRGDAHDRGGARAAHDRAALAGTSCRTDYARSNELLAAGISGREERSEGALSEALLARRSAHRPGDRSRQAEKALAPKSLGDRPRRGRALSTNSSLIAQGSRQVSGESSRIGCTRSSYEEAPHVGGSARSRSDCERLAGGRTDSRERRLRVPDA